MKRLRMGKTPPSEKALATEPAKGEEVFQISEGKSRIVGVKRELYNMR